MKRYFELKALPNPEIIQSAVISELMQGLHGLLPPFNGHIGLAFPAYGQQRTLGGIIRLLGTDDNITNLHEQISRHSLFRDYSLITPISTIPQKIKLHARYERVHTKGFSHLNRLKKRHEARGSWSDELAQALKAKCSRRLDLPHLKLKSTSTQQSFMLFIKQTLQPQAGDNIFNSYGLSLKEATVPHF